MDCSTPGSSVHGISQARTLEWAVISFFRGFSPPTDCTHISCIGRQILYTEHRESPKLYVCVCVHKYIKMCIYSTHIHKYIYIHTHIYTHRHTHKLSRKDKNTVCIKVFLTSLLSVISLQRSWEKGVVRCHPPAFLCPASGSFHYCCLPPQDPLRRQQTRCTLFPASRQLHTLYPSLKNGNYCRGDK